MEGHEKTTFYSAIKHAEIPDLIPKHPEQPVQNNEKSTPKWLIPGAMVLLLAQIIGLVLWYGHNQRAEAKKDLNATVSKLQVVEKHGYNVKGFYTQITEQDNRLQSLTAMFLPFIIHDVKAEVAGVDQKISTQYGTILEQEKQKLTQKLAEVEGYLNKTRTYNYQGKQDVIDYHQQLKEKVESSAVTIPQVDGYLTGLTEKEEIMRKGLQTVLHDSFAELEKEYSIAVNYNYDSRESIEKYIERFGGTTKAGEVSLADIVVNLGIIDQNKKAIAQEVEEEKKQVVFTNIQNTTQEVDTLLAFFSQRSGYINEINTLNQYKNAVSQYSPDNFKSFTSAALQQKAERELYGLVFQPRQTKLAVEEKERQELLAKQKALAAESGIPVPPIDAPKLILIDVNKQRLYAYESGVSIFDQPVPVTTGKAGYDTVKGRFAIYLKTKNFRMRSPFPNEYYDNYVDFWMPFFEGYGLHDASWRSVYGTMDYPAVGSHGCVNTPYAYIQRLYDWADVGTTVLVI